MSPHYPNLSHQKYRPDIDGLRAVSVLAVVAFHAFPNSIVGGFIGVDIFFVISGYLITTIIFNNLERGTFEFAEFYVRRIKRIFPALIIVLIACYVFGWFALLSVEYRQLGKHIAAGVGFVSNLVLIGETGYFNNAAETKPLLHLWSLGVEEQFYLLWPPVLWLAWKCKLNLLTITFVVAIASFWLNLKGVNENSVATFFSPQTRFWELLSGSLVAWLALYKTDFFISIRNRLNRYLIFATHLKKEEVNGESLSNLISVAGLLLLVYGFTVITKDFMFPGLWALVPVMGAILIITAGPNAIINHIILSNKLVVWFGLISFPLYLWHWPLLSFARIVESEVPEISIRIAAVLVSIALAWLTYKFIEQPVRLGGSPRSKAVFLVLILFGVGNLGLLTYIKDGFGFRENATLKGYNGDIGHREFHRFIMEKYFPCTPEVIAKESLDTDDPLVRRCAQSKPIPEVDIALLGDSHAEHLFLGIAEALPSKNVAFYIKSSAPFIDNVDYKNIFNVVLTSSTIKEVFFTMHWYARNSEIPTGSTLDKELIKTVDALSRAGKEVYLIDGMPTFPFPPEKCKGKRWLATKSPSCVMSLEESTIQRGIYISALKKFSEARPNIKMINVEKYVCDDLFCNMTKGNEIFYRDNNHLNIKGSLYVGQRLIDDNRSIFK